MLDYSNEFALLNPRPLFFLFAINMLRMLFYKKNSVN